MFLLKRNIIFIFVLVLAGLFPSCKQERSVSGYYPVDSLLEEQIQLLTNTPISLQKEAWINSGHQDTLIASLDSATWYNELDMFNEIDWINRPINQGSYTVLDKQKDPYSNLIIREYRANKPMAIRYLKLYYQDTPVKLRKLESLYEMESALLSSKRKLTMEFTDLYNKNILSSYSVEGEQKLVVGDSVHYLIKGKVQFN
ncbi:MAG: hypothetical protein MUC73_10810 [Cyclobacteriaceae bacterium]|jgi:hypothetical protein|nr:hypothetical protein [Cyclobacteriaceae bacterium]